MCYKFTHLCCSLRKNAQSYSQKFYRLKGEGTSTFWTAIITRFEKKIHLRILSQHFSVCWECHRRVIYWLCLILKSNCSSCGRSNKSICQNYLIGHWGGWMILTVSGKTYTFLLLQEKQNINWKIRYGYFCYYDDHVTIATESVDMNFFYLNDVIFFHYRKI